MKGKSGRRNLGKAIVILIKNTTWRCGKLERLIVKHLLHRKTAGFGKSEVPLNEMLRNFNLTGKKRNEFLDALKRLEKRNIIRIQKL